MAKKGGQVQLQVEVNNDDDWAKLLEREGLIIVDVYSDWCGPCSAMSGNLKKIKLEVGGDFLHLAMAKCDNIKDLARFRDKSEPTWMFIAGGKMVNLMFGANSPKLQQAVLDELKKEEAVKEGTRQREETKITSLSPEEQARYDEIQKGKLEQEEIEAAARLKAKSERLSVIVNAIATAPQQNYGLIVVFPYALDRLDQLSELWELHKQGNSEKIPLKNINIDDMLFYTSYRFPPEVLEQAETGNCNVYLVKNEDPELNIDTEMLKIVYGESMEPPGSAGSIAERLLTPYVPKTDDDQQEKEGKPDEKMLDGIWVPSDRKTRLLAMFMFFPNVVGAHVPPEPEPIPPHVAVAFDAWKQNEVLAAVEEYSNEVMHMGYFTDERPDVAKLICKTAAGYARRVGDQGEKLVLQLSKKRSDAVLAFAQIGPTYMSINPEVGAKECKKFFPEGYSEEDDVSMISTVSAKRGKGKRKPDDLTPTETGGDAFVEGQAAGEDFDVLGEDEEISEEGEEDEGEEDEDENENEGDSSATDTTTTDTNVEPPEPPPETEASIIKTTILIQSNNLPPLGDKIIIQLSKNLNDAVSRFVKLGPTYMSPNSVVGAEECKLFFPEGYENKDNGQNSTMVKAKSSKRRRKAIQSSGEETAISLSEGGDLESNTAGDEVEIIEEEAEEELEEIDGDDLLDEDDEGRGDVDKATSPMDGDYFLESPHVNKSEE